MWLRRYQEEKKKPLENDIIELSQGIMPKTPNQSSQKVKLVEKDLIELLMK